MTCYVQFGKTGKREGGDGKDTMKNPFSSMNIQTHEWQERFDLYCETENSKQQMSRKVQVRKLTQDFKLL